MNPKLSFIFERRSVRKYLEQSIPEETIHDLLEAAMAAPSACCKDPWHFVVIRQRDMLRTLAEGLPNGKMLADAAAGIAVCGNLSKAHGNEESYMLQDCSAAVENILLSAAALGLGAVWLGVHPRPDRIALLRAQLHLPPPVMPVAMVALGWRAETPAPRTRFSKAALHWEQWEPGAAGSRSKQGGKTP